MIPESFTEVASPEPVKPDGSSNDQSVVVNGSRLAIAEARQRVPEERHNAVLIQKRLGRDRPIVKIKIPDYLAVVINTDRVSTAGILYAKVDDPGRSEYRRDSHETVAGVLDRRADSSPRFINPCSLAIEPVILRNRSQDRIAGAAVPDNTSDRLGEIVRDSHGGGTGYHIIVVDTRSIEHAVRIVVLNSAQNGYRVLPGVCPGRKRNC